MGLKHWKRLTDALVWAIVSCGPCVTTGAAAASNDSCVPIVALAQKLNNTERGRSVKLYVRADGSTAQEEYVIIGSKRYARLEGGPWHVNRRELTPIKTISNCEYIDRERVNGIETKVYAYERQDWQAVYEVRMWIAEGSGLPVKSHWKETKPNIVHNEWYLTYFFEPDIKEPI